MLLKKIVVIFLIVFALFCSLTFVSAAEHNDTLNNMVYEIDSNDESISVSNDEHIDNMEEYESVLSAQSKNANWTVNVDGLSDDDLLSGDDFDDDDDPDDGEYNNYVDNNDYSEVDKNKEYFYNRIHSETHYILNF